MTHEMDAARAFLRAYQARQDNGFAHLRAPLLNFGWEKRTVPSEYIWDGLKRLDSDPAYPAVLFQATLSGWGAYKQGRREWKVGQGAGFFTVIPSRHVYRLPPESAEWSFFWLRLWHPWAVERISKLAARYSPVFALPADSKLMAASRSFYEQVCYRRLPDAFAEEGAMLEWMLEFERHLHELAHPREPREKMLGKLRAFTLAHLSSSFGIEEFARQEGLSRSHYSHRFKQATGLAPAAYVVQVRLAEARRRIRKTLDPLKDIAVATGFADANHFCKVFRRLYHITPGVYRKQILS